MSQPLFFPAEAMRTFVQNTLKRAGVEEPWAMTTGTGLWHASMRGVDSHGIRLLPHYLDGIRLGRINPSPSMTFTRTMAATGTLDADNALGHAAGVKAMHHAMTLAEEAGVGMVSVRRSSHCGAMGYFALQACERDMLGLAFTHATARVMTPGGTNPFFGNNPICMAAPMRDEEPFCYDGATTTITFNAVKAFGEQGLPLPPGLAADANGQFTECPAEATQLAPIGGYKGMGLSMVVDILCALLSGMPAGPEVSAMYGSPLTQPRNLGQCFAAIRISAFEDPARFRERMQTLAEDLRRVPSLGESSGPMAPGDPEKAHFRQRMRTGIPLCTAVADSLRARAAEFGLAFPKPLQGEEEVR